MLNKLLITFLIGLQTIVCFAQDIPIGSWRDHLPYSDAISVTEGNGIVYCATNSALFTYNKSDFTIERLNLITGLSDIGLSKIKYNDYNKTVIVTYTNGNIDIINSDKNITNLSFVKNSNILGTKTINHIFIEEKFAYLSTGFGIVVLDTEKLEIVDTYFFGPLGNSLFTNAVTTDNLNIYAATNEGVYFANKNSTNLADYNIWSLLPELGTETYGDIVHFSNKLFVIFDSPGWKQDSLLYNNAGSWQALFPEGTNIESLSISADKLILTKDDGINIFDSALVLSANIFTVNDWFYIAPKETCVDNDGTIWYAENEHGLIKSKNNYNNEIIVPNGPSSETTFDMDFVDGDLWKVSGGYNNSNFGALYNSKNLINYLINDKWENVGKNINDANGNIAYDAVNVVINPSNKNQVYVGTWNNGLFELNNGTITNIYNAQNSSLDSTFTSTKIGSMAFDKDNILWVLSSSKQLNSFAQNQWHTFAIPNTGGAPTSLAIDDNKTKWIGMQNKNSIVAYNDNGTLDDLSDDQTAVLTANLSNFNSDINAYNPNIPGAALYSLALDLDGEIWVGTDEGIAVFYNPSNVFSENIEAEQIYIQQDGQTQILLETEIINVIKVDGANRKWIGTQSSGAYLMSEDGTEQVEHFTKDNSPLFSNNIFDIELNPKTGEVFFATEKGLISYKGTATAADTDFNNVFVYPNPVKPDFNGTIAIRGLVKDTDLRITDISGNIVFQTKSLGGQAVWDGKDFNGNKVQTGVYMVFNGSPQGELKAVAKILFIH